MNEWIYTYSGKKFYFLNPTPDTICVEDIAHSLSRLCRFNGHIKQHYSVAQHSVLCSCLVADEFKLAALFHDASEAYVGDLVSPLKRLLAQSQDRHGIAYEDVERDILNAVASRFGYLNTDESKVAVKAADITMLVTEAKCLFLHPLNLSDEKKVEPLNYEIDPWTAQQAEYIFLTKFYQLTNGKS